MMTGCCERDSCLDPMFLVRVLVVGVLVMISMCLGICRRFIWGFVGRKGNYALAWTNQVTGSGGAAVRPRATVTYSEV